jgi:hypothetical protein
MTWQQGRELLLLHVASVIAAAQLLRHSAHHSVLSGKRDELVVLCDSNFLSLVVENAIRLANRA